MLAGGVNALILAVQMLVDAGDEVVAVTPVWPNLTAQPLIMGAKLKRVSLVPKDGAWTLDLARLLDAITPATKLLVVNAPNNPTGWTLSRVRMNLRKATPFLSPATLAPKTRWWS